MFCVCASVCAFNNNKSNSNTMQFFSYYFVVIIMRCKRKIHNCFCNKQQETKFEYATKNNIYR